MMTEPTNLPDNETGPSGAMPLGPGISVADADLDFSFARSSGPGGQGVNKVASKAELRVRVEAIRGLDEPARDRLRRLAGQRLTRDDVIVLHAEEHRSQRHNRRACLSRLRQLVQEAAKRPKRRKPTRPTRSSVEKRLDAKKAHGEKKQRRQKNRMRRGEW